MNFWEFPGDPVVLTWHFYYSGPGSIHGQGTKMLQIRGGQKKKKKKHLRD